MFRTISTINTLIDWVNENPINFTWSSPKTEVKRSLIPNSGYGRFAVDNIKHGETVVVVGGIALTEEEYNSIRTRYNYATGLLVESNFKLQQLSFLSENNGTINHGCSPNCSMFGQIVIRATQDIMFGEELYIDYGTIADQDLVMFDNCQCGSNECRSYVTGKDWLSSAFVKKHKKNFSLYLLEQIEMLNDDKIFADLSALKKINLTYSKLLSEEYRKLI